MSSHDVLALTDDMNKKKIDGRNFNIIIDTLTDAFHVLTANENSLKKILDSSKK